MTKREKQIIDIYEKNLLKFTRETFKIKPNEELLKDLSYQLNSIVPHVKILVTLMKIEGLEKTTSNEDESELLKFMQTILNTDKENV